MAKKKTSRTKTTARKSIRGKKAISTKKKSSTRPRREPAPETTEPSAAVGDMEVTIDRRRSAGRRAEDLARGPAAPSMPLLERRQKVNRRRQIDPTTCERDYSDDEVEFMNALDEYKRKNGRMFPTCSEVLEVIRDLGYVKTSPVALAESRQAQQRPAEALETSAT